jgi:predicted PurR-regulated permease PerM
VHSGRLNALALAFQHDRRALSASLMTLLVTVVVLLPIVVLAVALSDDIAEVSRTMMDLLREGLPDAPEWLATLPLVGLALQRYWEQFAHNGERLIEELLKLAEPAQSFALDAGKLVGRGVIDIALSVFLAFFLYLHGEALAKRVRYALALLSGERAIYLLSLTRGTINGVIYGVLGTALAQAVLASIGLAIAGVPGAVLLGAATFLLSVVPVGPPLVWGGAAIWLFQQGDLMWAIFMAAWGFFVVSTVDNFIKPFIISRGAKLPFAVVFMGVLGGVLAFGVIGAFLGPALLAVGFRLLSEWSARAPD